MITDQDRDAYLKALESATVPGRTISILLPSPPTAHGSARDFRLPATARRNLRPLSATIGNRSTTAASSHNADRRDPALHVDSVPESVFAVGVVHRGRRGWLIDHS